MKGKTVVITGGTSGIGEIAGERLAQMGARIVLIARDKSRGVARLHGRAPGLGHAVHYADLARVPEMKRVAADITHKEPRIDVLINNAGAMFSIGRLTEDGGEYTFALNHMAYFVVTEGLRERFLASAPARIVSVSSAAPQGARLDFDGQEFWTHESLWSLQALQHSFHARTRPPPAWHGVTTNCLHPGFIATRFGDQSGCVISRFVGLAKLFAIPPEKGAETIIYLASSAAVTETTGVYFYKYRPITASHAARDDRAALLVWERSAALASFKV
jgi:retinol dehydrogenase 12